MMPTAIGPTWKRDQEGKFILPALTLGWQQLGWTVEYLQQPDGPHAEQPLQLTDEQARFLLWWSAIDEEGQFLYRYAMLRRLKGWGKDPMGSFVCALEFVGPCRFDRWENGQPVAVSNPAAWVQTAAVSKDQTRNTMTLFPGLFSPKAIAKYKIELGKEIIYAERGKRRLEAVTSSPRALEGGRVTFVLKNETHHWRATDEGHEMARVIARNAAKTQGRVLAISNAHAPGEDSDAEHDWDAWRKIDQGISASKGMLYDSLEAPDTDLEDDESLRAGLMSARGDSVWLNVPRLMAEIRDPRTSPAMARRFYLNQIVAEEDKPFDRKRWDELAEPRVVQDGVTIVLGFDGSISRDHTVLIGTEVATGYQWVVGYWEPEPIDGELRINFQSVDQTVDDAFRRWKVWRLNADPYKWGVYLSVWAGKYGSETVVSWSTTQYRKMAQSLAQYRVAQVSGAVTHDGDPRFAAAMANAHKHMQQFRDDDGNPMWVIQKERPDSPLKIDAAVAGSLSWEARGAAIAAGVRNREDAATPNYVTEDRGVPEMSGARTKEF